LTFTQLKKQNNNYKLISVAGHIFDVSSAIMVYNSPMSDIPNAIGNDITFALLKNEYKQENYNLPLNTIMENKEYKERLKSIFKTFCETYCIVGQLDDPLFEITWEDDDDWHIVQSNDANY